VKEEREKGCYYNGAHSYSEKGRFTYNNSPLTSTTARSVYSMSNDINAKIMNMNLEDNELNKDDKKEEKM